MKQMSPKSQKAAKAALHRESPIVRVLPTAKANKSNLPRSLGLAPLITMEMVVLDPPEPISPARHRRKTA